MKKLPCVALIILLLLPLFVSFDSVFCTTSVGGTISSNTTWSRAAGPYKLTDNVVVNKGVTLTIDPGVTVDFDGHSLEIDGTLHAQGTNTSKIHFTTDNRDSYLAQVQFVDSSTDWSSEARSGCLLENIVFTQVTVSVKDCSPKISYNIFSDSKWSVEVTIRALGGSPLITGNIFQNVSYQGISVGKNTQVTNNLFNMTTGSTTAIVAHENAVISNNKILNFWAGIRADDTNIVKDNVVVNCTNVGISIASTISTASIAQNNYIANNKIGLAGSGQMKSNTIINNEIGISIYGQATITDNNIIDNIKNSFSLESQETVDATNNWWGTADSRAVTQMVEDSKDPTNKGTVNFKPFLNHPSSSAPSSMNLDAPSITDTDPFVIPNEAADTIIIVAEIAAISLVACWGIVVVVLVTRRKRKQAGQHP